MAIGRRLRPRHAAAGGRPAAQRRRASATASACSTRPSAATRRWWCIAGEAGVKYDAMDAQMAADLVAMAKPVTKWATRVVDPPSMLRVLRRAIKIAARRRWARCSWPADGRARRAQRRAGRADVDPVDTRVVAGRAAGRRGGEMLVGAERPMIIIGDGVAIVRRPGRADPRGRAARRRGLGRELRRGQHRRTTHPLYHGAWATCSATTAGRDHDRRPTPS